MSDNLKIIKALADENRLKIIKLLLRKKLCVGGLAKRLNISEPAVSQKLKILKQAGLVSSEKKSYYVHYSVKEGKLHKIGEYLMNLSKKPQENSI